MARRSSSSSEGGLLGGLSVSLDGTSSCSGPFFSDRDCFLAREVAGGQDYYHGMPPSSLRDVTQFCVSPTFIFTSTDDVSAFCDATYTADTNSGPPSPGDVSDSNYHAMPSPMRDVSTLPMEVRPGSSCLATLPELQTYLGEGSTLPSTTLLSTTLGLPLPTPLAGLPWSAASNYLIHRSESVPFMLDAAVEDVILLELKGNRAGLLSGLKAPLLRSISDAQAPSPRALEALLLVGDGLHKGLGKRAW